LNKPEKHSFKWYFSEQNPVTAYLYLLPHAVFFFIFLVYPIFKGLYVSFTQWDMLANTGKWTGLENYRVLFDKATEQGSYFWQALGNTLIFVVISVPFLVLIALALALLLTGTLPGRNFFRTAFFIPTALSVTVIAVIWRWLLNGDFGLINYILAACRLPKVPWLTNQPFAWISLLLATIWWTVGWNTILFISGINAIPEQIFEAAKIDGAGGWHRFRYITLPCLGSVMFYVLITTVIASFNLFGQPQLMMTVGDHPMRSVMPVMFMIYNEAWVATRMGTAASMSYVTALVIMGVTFIQSRFYKDRVDDFS
jgi:ABC-type sugar transport systems, permease components